MKYKLWERNFHDERKKVVGPLTNTVTEISQIITKNKAEIAKENNKAISDLNEKVSKW